MGDSSNSSGSTDSGLRRSADRAGAGGGKSAVKQPTNAHNKAKVEEFAERGMGVAGKE